MNANATLRLPREWSVSLGRDPRLDVILPLAPTGSRPAPWALCLAPAPEWASGPYFCIRPKGHTGRHADTHRGRIIAVWERER